MVEFAQGGAIRADDVGRAYRGHVAPDRAVARRGELLPVRGGAADLLDPVAPAAAAGAEGGGAGYFF